MPEPTPKKTVTCWHFGASPRSRAKVMRKGLGKQTFTRLRQKIRTK